MASDAIDDAAKRRLREQFAALDPVALLNTMREVQQELLTVSNHQERASTAPTQPEYLAAFATAW